MEILIRLDESMKHLTARFDAFVDSTQTEVKQIKDDHKCDMESIWSKIGALEAKANMANGAWIFLTTALALLAATKAANLW